MFYFGSGSGSKVSYDVCRVEIAMQTGIGRYKDLEASSEINMVCSPVCVC